MLNTRVTFKLTTFIVLILLKAPLSSYASGEYSETYASTTSKTLLESEMINSAEVLIDLATDTTEWPELYEPSIAEYLREGDFNGLVGAFGGEINADRMEMLDDIISFLTTASNLDTSDIDFTKSRKILETLYNAADKFSVSGSHNTTTRYLEKFLEQIYDMRTILLENLTKLRERDQKLNYKFRQNGCTFFTYLSRHMNALVARHFEIQADVRGCCRTVKLCKNRFVLWRRRHQIALRTVLVSTLLLVALAIPFLDYYESRSSSTEVTTLTPTTDPFSIGSNGNCTITVHNTINVVSSEPGTLKAILTGLNGIAALGAVLNELLGGPEEINSGFQEDMFKAYVTAQGLLESADRHNHERRRRKKRKSRQSYDEDSSES